MCTFQTQAKNKNKKSDTKNTHNINVFKFLTNIPSPSHVHAHTLMHVQALTSPLPHMYMHTHSHSCMYKHVYTSKHTPRTCSQYVCQFIRSTLVGVSHLVFYAQSTPAVVSGWKLVGDREKPNTFLHCPNKNHSHHYHYVLVVTDEPLR